MEGQGKRGEGRGERRGEVRLKHRNGVTKNVYYTQLSLEARVRGHRFRRSRAKEATGRRTWTSLGCGFVGRVAWVRLAGSA